MSSGQDDPDMVAVSKQCQPQVVEIFQVAAEQEKEWARYLFKDGSMIGLNAEILSSYVEYITNTRMKALGLEGIFPHLANPLPWMNAWLVSDNVQVAPQEAEISSYLVGAIDSDLDDSDFDDFDL
jgi:ribonucleoside-diphosphate reductase beta chain